jgi:tubulin--tyrosine ligase-like protein 12
LDNLDDYEKHFTVMNYKPSVTLKQIHYNEFIPKFEEQNPEFKWSGQLEQKIFKMIRQVFEGACKEKPPKGIAHNVQSRAMYAVDLMLDWREDEKSSKSIEPMICEINFMPDCTRACTYHPSFFNDVFSTLFLDDNSHNNVTEI